MPIDKFHPDTYNEEEYNLLEYVRVVADKYAPDFVFEEDGKVIPVDSQAPFLFQRRYNLGRLNGDFTYDGYMKIDRDTNENIQDIIQALGIDPDKFWYLLLFVYDYVIGKTHDTTSYKMSTVDQIEQFIEYVESNELSFDPFEGIKHELPMVLTISRGSKHKLVITNPNTISLIASMCKDALPSLRKNCESIYSPFNSREKDKEDVSKSTSVKIWLFTCMLRYFFDQYPQFANKRSTGNTTTKSTLKFISKLIHFVKLTDNKAYNEDDDCLKAIIKQYRNYKIDTINSIYG